MLEAYYRCCSVAAERFGGHLAQYAGDSVVLYFGYPQAYELSSVAAVEAGLEIVDAVAALSEQITQGRPVGTRVGVHTGLTVVGDVGQGTSHTETTVVGDLPVIASRIQTFAQPGTVVISEATRRLVDRYTELVDLGRHELKGLSHPIGLYEARSVIDRRALLDKAAPRVGGGGLVGRDGEREILLERWRLAHQRHGRVVIIGGEAGIGKSRILEVIADVAADEGAAILRYQCTPYRRSSALFPVIERLRREARIATHDSDDVKFAKLKRLLADPGDEVMSTLATLLAIPPDGRFKAPEVTPEQLKQATFRILLEQVHRLSEVGTVLILFEDVHWADPTSLELLGMIVHGANRLRLLCAITCRSDFEPPWGMLPPHVARLSLDRLADEQVRAIVEGAAGKLLPEGLAQQIVARADGVPLFAEELTRSMLESGSLVEGEYHFEAASPQEFAIPATLQDTLLTRLDHLGAVKEVAQAAAAIGREFSFDLLCQISPLRQDELARALQRLTAAGLIEQGGEEPPAAYTFKHALVQNAAYESMLKSTRREQHRKIAVALAEEPKIRDTQADLLARHYREADDAEQAIRYYRLAGERAVAGSHYEEAIAHFERAARVLDTLEPSRYVLEQKLDVQNALGNVLVVARGYSSPEVERACAISRELCEALGSTELLFTTLWNLTGFHMVRGEHAACTDLNARLLAIAEGSPDPELALMAHDTVGQTLVYTGRPREAREHLDRAAELYQPGSNLADRYGGEDPGVATYGFLAVAQWLLGDSEGALASATRAEEIAESLDNPHSMALALNQIAEVHFLRRDVEGARAATVPMLEISEQQGFPYYLPTAQVLHGWVVAQDGDLDRALELITTGIDGLERLGARLERPVCCLLLAEVHMAAGRAQVAVNVLDEALGLIEVTGERCFEAELLRLKAQALGPGETAPRLLAEALAIAREQGAVALEQRVEEALLTARS